MQHDPNYVKGLEELVLKLLPVYDRYYDLTGAPKPPLESQVIKSVVKKTPALFQTWPLKD